MVGERGVEFVENLESDGILCCKNLCVAIGDDDWTVPTSGRTEQAVRERAEV